MYVDASIFQFPTGTCNWELWAAGEAMPSIQFPQEFEIQKKNRGDGYIYINTVQG